MSFATSVFMLVSFHAANQDPVVYWATSPTLANETLMLAGAGFEGGGGSGYQWCTGSATISHNHWH
jgi:hypothetical protein